MTPLRRQRGVALLVAIMLVAIGTILAASIAFQSAMAARRGIASMSFEQSVLVAQGAEALAAYGLREGSGNTVDYSQSWAQPFGPTEITPGVVLEAHMEDMAGRFNLNSLVKSDGSVDTFSREVFLRLLESLQIEPKWADQLIDWIDPDPNPTGFDGLEDSGTTNQQPPYRNANTWITSISDLLALPGFGRERYLKLAPFVAALPVDTALNVCTAPGVVLDAMADEQEFAVDPEALAKSRQKECFPEPQEFISRVVQKNQKDGLEATAIGSHLGKTSTYFRLTSLVTLGGSDFALYSLLLRPGGGGGSGTQGKVRVLQRSFTPD